MSPARKTPRTTTRTALALTSATALALLMGPAATASAETAPAETAPAGQDAGAQTTIRQAVVEAGRTHLGKPYQLEYGWTCQKHRMDCECFNRNAVWEGTANATGQGLQLNYWLQGQINQGTQVANPRPGDLVFWDTDPNDGIAYGGDLDHTGVYIGGTDVIEASLVDGVVQYNTTTLGGAYNNPLFIDVLTPNGY